MITPIQVTLHKLKRRLKTIVVLERLGIGMPVLVALVVGLGLGEYFFWFSPAVKSVLLLGLGLAPAAGLAYWLAAAWLKDYPDSHLALMVEKRYPDFKGQLVCTVELAERLADTRAAFSRTLYTRVMEQAAAGLTETDIKQVTSVRRLVKVGRISLAVTLGLTAGILGGRSRLYASWQRLLSPLTVYSPVPRTLVTVAPGNAEVVRGDSLTVTARFSGEVPAGGDIYFRWENRSVWEGDELRACTTGTFGYTFRKIEKSFSYYVHSPGAQSRTFSVSVLNRPVVKQLTWSLKPPAYTGIGPANLTENIKQVEVPVGTRITLGLVANKALDSVQLVFDDSTKVAGTTQADHASVQFTAFRNQEFFLNLVDKQHIRNREPILYSLTVRRDESPQVKILWPGHDVEIADNLQLPLKLSLWDDYGFSQLLLFYRINDEKWHQVEIPLPAKGMETAFEYHWDLNQVNLLPDEVVSYYIKVYDNDRIAGPKTAVSQTFKIRLPSIYELFEEIDQEQNQQIKDLQETVRRGQELKEKVEQMNRELLNDAKLDWERKKEVQGILKKQQELAEQVEKVTEALSRTIEKMQDNDMMTMETVQKMSAIRDLMREIATPEMKDLMKKINDAMNRVDLKALQEQMKNFTFSQKDYLEKLDRTLSLLKRIKAEQELDEALKKTEELKARQEEVNQAAGRQNQDQQLGKKEERIGKDTKQLESELKALAEGMQELSQLSSEELKKAAAFLDREQLSQSMLGMSQQLNAGQMNAAQKSGQQIKQGLNRLAQMLAAAKDQLVNSEKDNIIKKIKHVITDLLYLSQEEEQLYDITNGLRNRSQRFREMAEGQLLVLDGMSPLVSKVMDLVRETVFIPSQVGAQIGMAYSFMQKGIQGMEDRNARWAALNQKGAFSALNQAVIELRNTAEKISQMASMSQASLMQQLQNMAQKQGGINQMTQSLMQMLGSGALSLEQQATLSRLASQQEALRQQLESIQQQVGEMGSKLGNLSKMGQDMKEVAEDLKGHTVDQKTLEKQNAIFNRLLDYQRSVKKNDISRERKAETGQDFRRSSPGPLDESLGQTPDRFREEVLRALKEKYPKEYQDLIKAYFKRLTEDEK